MLPMLKTEPGNSLDSGGSYQPVSHEHHPPGQSTLSHHLSMPSVVGGLQQPIVMPAQVAQHLNPVGAVATWCRGCKGSLQGGGGPLRPGPPPLPVFQQPPIVPPSPARQPIRFPPATSAEPSPARSQMNTPTARGGGATTALQSGGGGGLRLASPAIRQALGHPSTSLTSISSQHDELLDRKRLDELVRLVDPHETLEEDVKDALLQLTDDFIEQLLDQSCRLARHRNSDRLETQDVHFVLQRQWNIWMPGASTSQHKPWSKSPVNEAHKQRMAIIKKTLKKP